MPPANIVWTLATLLFTTTIVIVVLLVDRYGTQAQRDIRRAHRHAKKAANGRDSTVLDVAYAVLVEELRKKGD